MKPRSWPKVEELYHAALERPVAEREGFLDEACGGDDELQNEVQSLLSHEREADRLMERPGKRGTMKPRNWPKVEELYHAALDRQPPSGRRFSTRRARVTRT